VKHVEGLALGSLLGVIAVGVWLSFSGGLNPAATVAGAGVSSAPMTRTVMQGGEIGIMPMSRLIDPQTGVACYTAGNHFACVMIGEQRANELSRTK
jgi:hypothetical protein